MLRIAVCDDDLRELKNIHEMVLGYCSQRAENDIAVKCFSASTELTASLDQGERFEVFLLDVLMPQIGGIELGRVIRRKDSQAVIIYLTTSEEHALDSYSVKAFDYVLKPLRREKLHEVLDSALEQVEGELNRRMIIRTYGGAEAVPIAHISYIECDKHNLICHLADGRIIESLTMRKSFKDAVAPLMEDERFLRISVSFVINMNYVRSVNKNGFIMPDGKELSVTRSYKGAQQTYIDFVLKRGLQI